MKSRDLIKMCVQNLFRRKSRTLLTVLGVIIGCCSIVIMVSIGIGMKESQEKMLLDMGDITIIDVMSPNDSKSKNKLNDKLIGEIQAIENVEIVSPKITAENVTVKLYTGTNKRFSCEYVTLVGLNPKAIEKLGYKLFDGGFQDRSPQSVLVGRYFAYGFMDSYRPEDSNRIDPYVYDADFNMLEPPEPFFSPLKAEIEMEIGLDSNKITEKINPVGILKEDYGKGFETFDGIIMDLKELEKMLDNIGQKNNNVKKEKGIYSSAIIKVNHVQNVAEVEKKIKTMGFRTDSMESIREPLEKDARQKQMMLGGLGAISLIVAAIGITNTMIMSISERTREIGIMKSLGCYVKDIRRVFLFESGLIGLLGGIAGALISIITSVIINVASSQTPITRLYDIVDILITRGSRISVVPFWLVIFALVFSVIIGLCSGYYPANKAVRISALEAIKYQ